jgi:flagellar protein FlgJ
MDKSAGAADESGATAGLPANVRGFIDRMRPYAEAAARTMGVPAHLLLAQAGLETGWGRAQPRTDQGAASHNLFGIKAGPGWTGAVAAASTTEYVAGALVRTVERFRSYGSYTEAFQDFARLITGNARYAGALTDPADPAAYARGLQKGGYATDPQYADKLLRAIRMVAGHLAPGNGAGPDAVAAADTPAPAQVSVAAAVNTSRTSKG